MPRNSAQKDLTPKDVTAICTAAAKALGAAPKKARKAKFTWRGKSYVASHTSFRLMVNTPSGLPVACRWD